MSEKAKTQTTQTDASKLSARFSYNVQRLRVKAQLTQLQFAKRMKLSASMISKMEAQSRHNRRDPSFHTVEKAAKVLDVDPVLLLKPIPVPKKDKEPAAVEA